MKDNNGKNGSQSKTLFEHIEYNEIGINNIEKKKTEEIKKTTKMYLMNYLNLVSNSIIIKNNRKNWQRYY